MKRIDGKVAIVTGAANGIGKAISLLLANQGAMVACADLNLGKGKGSINNLLIPSVSENIKQQIYGNSLAQTVTEIKKAGGNAIGVQTDVSDEESCDNLVWCTRRLLGPADILVNCAMLTYFMPTMEIPGKWWERSFAVSVHGIFLLSKKVLPYMISKHAGVIVNISSPAAIGRGRGPYGPQPFTTSNTGPPTLYAATKAAVECFTQGLAEEVYQYGISVNCVSPSTLVNTPGVKQMKVTSPVSEPPETMAKAVLLLITEPQDKVTGRVTYSQAILKEFGWITKGEGVGIDSEGSGYSQR